MKPEIINQKELFFFNSLKENTNKVFHLENTEKIIDGTEIHCIRPKHSSYFYNEKTSKKSICMHFTAGCITSDAKVLTKENNHVSVSYLIDRLGNIYNLFDDSYWSYHLGAGAIGGNKPMSKQTIGIEISNYGQLNKVDGNLLDIYKNIYCDIEETEFYEEINFRDFSYFATMTQKQILSTAALLKHLCKKHNIPISFKQDNSLFSSDKDAVNYTGIFTHANVRKEKYDWPMCQSFFELMRLCLA